MLQGGQAKEDLSILERKPLRPREDVTLTRQMNTPIFMGQASATRSQAAGKPFIALLGCPPTPDSLFPVMLYSQFPSKCHLKITRECKDTHCSVHYDFL